MKDPMMKSHWSDWSLLLFQQRPHISPNPHFIFSLCLLSIVEIIGACSQARVMNFSRKLTDCKRWHSLVSAWPLPVSIWLLSVGCIVGQAIIGVGKYILERFDQHTARPTHDDKLFHCPILRWPGNSQSPAGICTIQFSQIRKCDVEFEFVFFASI